MNLYCTFYIVRHGESKGNVQEIMGGDELYPLTNTGKQQAKLRAQDFSNIKFAAVFSSDILRAKQTAKILSIDHKLAIITQKALRERLFGHMEGKTYEEYYRKFEKLIEKKERLTHEQKRSLKFAPDIESDEEVITRFITFLREIAIASTGKTILVVSHGGPIRLLLLHLAWADEQKLKPGFVPNTGYIKLRSDGVDFFVDEVVTSNQ